MKAIRRPMIAGNWKMNGSKASVTALLEGLKQGCDAIGDVDLVVFPSFVFLAQVQQTLTDTRISWGAQNVSDKTSGAYTGEVAATMLCDFACRYVLVGHSERRHLYAESDDFVAHKFVVARTAKLIPVLCVGETQQQRQANKTYTVIENQLLAVLQMEAGVNAFSEALIAYEPVWAIGTGLSATPEQAQEVHSAIRSQLAKFDEKIAQQVRILYGGSLKSSNAASLFAMPDIDGGLIGGASLDAQKFLNIASILSKLCNN